VEFCTAFHAVTPMAGRVLDARVARCSYDYWDEGEKEGEEGEDVNQYILEQGGFGILFRISSLALIFGEKTGYVRA
jgi:hypothetical protein